MDVEEWAARAKVALRNREQFTDTERDELVAHIRDLSEALGATPLRLDNLERLSFLLDGVAVAAQKALFLLWKKVPSEVHYTLIELYEALALAGRVVPMDGLHHAPMCPANHYHKQRIPSGFCTCGAAEEAAQEKAQ